ncbi:hypothetical protein MLD38_037637 [Melastoma candidum]|uniref:Uncharacterized protein n=1 Tax=Melastoma candidum TaxID=119954 RepID=A0ACB9LNZ7_9MYRT|nr:hypothetical protein MLD38_037637 [Melastoma candidum]
MHHKVEERHPRPDAVTCTGVPIVQPSHGMGSWTTGLCGCFEDFTNCCITCWCPCVTFGQNAEIIDRGKISCVRAGMVCYSLGHFTFHAIYTCTYRSKLRGQYSIPGDQCADFCIHCWCPFCAFCQEHRELVNRGLDPSMGWVTNRETQNRQIGMTVAPASQQGMTRT